ncbi:MAG: hypothetical protein M1497_00545 [Nitrospirae bacterium]|nr:hypothetical protein [Nitrospirota bacterium]
MPEERTEVTAYSGSRGEEIPRSFILRGDVVVVEKILGMWIEEESSGRQRKRCFKVKGSDGYTHILSYDEAKGAWSLKRTGA